MRNAFTEEKSQVQTTEKQNSQAKQAGQ